MKKILITILALIAAFVLCFAFVACDGDNSPTGTGSNPTDKNDPTGDGDDPGTVSIKLNDALDVIDGVLSSKGFTATATYTLSSKNNEAVTESISIDKRGSKIKIDDVIVDYATGYVYTNVGGGEYTFGQEFTAGNIDYIKYMITSFAGKNTDAKLTAHYDEETKTVKLSVNLAENVNKYLDPLQTAYKNQKTLGAMLDEYSVLLFDKKFDEVYGIIEAYIKNPKNTFGSLLDLLKEKAGVDVEALLKEFDVNVPADILTAIKQRQIGAAVVGAYNYIKGYMSGNVGGMTNIEVELLNAIMAAEVTPAQVEAALVEIKSMLQIFKELSFKTLIDTAFAQEQQPSELYTAIKNGVKFKDISMTVTFTVNDSKTVTGVKADFLVAHTYNGVAPENFTVLADNDYLISAEIKIDEYKTEATDFDIKFSPEAYYKTSVAQVMYEFTDKDISVYYETAGNTVKIARVDFEKYTPDGKLTTIENAPEGAFKFDEATSSFVFDAAFVKSVLENATAGTYLYANIVFDGDKGQYCVTLVYLNDNIEEVSSYLTDYFMSIIKNVGGSDMPGDPNVSEKPSDVASQA
ncbi:MAG: hypothetical protein K2O04_06980 [Clostridiales bacterium]|nr:hypothetical protein [Clostridiales bacterium]